MTESDSDVDGSVEVRLSVPAGMRYQLVYRQERSRPFPETPIAGHAFRFLKCPTGLWKILREVKRAFGVAGMVKAALKLVTKKRRLYVFTTEGRVSHYGWVSVGFCNHYAVESRDAVLGPIWTDERDRGRGLATEAMRRAMNVLIADGHEVFFIDTGGDNIPCQRAIAKASFPPAVGAYLRGMRE